MTEWLLAGLGALLTVGTALFVAAEFSLVALDRSSVQRAVDAGDGAAAPVLDSLRRLSTQLSAAQVGITLTTLVLGWLAQPSIGALLGKPLHATSCSWQYRLINALKHRAARMIWISLFNTGEYWYRS